MSDLTEKMPSIAYSGDMYPLFENFELFQASKLNFRPRASDRSTYYVPTTRLVLSWCSLPPKILAIPKSDIFGFISTSSRMLLGLRSLWIIVVLESWWRYISPLATPLIMLNLLGQSSIDFPAVSAKEQDVYVHECKASSKPFRDYFLEYAIRTYQKETCLGFCWVSIHK